MTAVKIRKRRPSKQRRMRRMTVAGGEKLLHSDEEQRNSLKNKKFVTKNQITVNSNRRL